MQHLLQPYAVKREKFAWWEGAFSEEELDGLQNKAKEAVQKAQVGGNKNGMVKDGIRRSELNWLPKTEESSWVFERLAGVVSNLNAKYFRFDLTGFGEDFTINKLPRSKPRNIQWHQDFGSASGPSRKLSRYFSCQTQMNMKVANLQLLTKIQRPSKSKEGL
jgi:hypothetical protein